jgi:hypothetical protein
MPARTEMPRGQIGRLVLVAAVRAGGVVLVVW